MYKSYLKKIFRLFPNKIRHTIIPNKGNIKPCSEFIELIKALKRENNNIRIAELGVDKGATTKEVLKLLDQKDVYDLFDRENCEYFINNNFNYPNNANVFANTSKTYDSYLWSLIKLYNENKKNDLYQFWDAVYLDGAHTYLVDTGSVCILKEMIKINGYFLLDDLKWTMKNSPTSNNNFNQNNFTNEQMKYAHINLINDIFLENDNRFVKIDLNKDIDRVLYQKIKS